MSFAVSHFEEQSEKSLVAEHCNSQLEVWVASIEENRLYVRCIVYMQILFSPTDAIQAFSNEL